MEAQGADNRYLLRIWRDQDDERAWRATLRDVRDGNVRSFVDLSELVEFLEGFSPESRMAGS